MTQNKTPCHKLSSSTYELYGDRFFTLPHFSVAADLREQPGTEVSSDVLVGEFGLDAFVERHGIIARRQALDGE